MKDLFILISLFFLACHRNPSALEQKERFFDPKDLSRLSLEEMNHFWEGDRIKHISTINDAIFGSHPGFLGGIEYRGDTRGISVSVFKSQAMAIEAMELLRKNVAAVIEPGNPPDLFPGPWWFTDNIPNAVFVNQWNTIVDVFIYHPDYKAVENLLLETAKEIAGRVDAFSD